MSFSMVNIYITLQNFPIDFIKCLIHSAKQGCIVSIGLVVRVVKFTVLILLMLSRKNLIKAVSRKFWWFRPKFADTTTASLTLPYHCVVTAIVTIAAFLHYLCFFTKALPLIEISRFIVDMRFQYDYWRIVMGFIIGKLSFEENAWDTREMREVGSKWRKICIVLWIGSGPSVLMVSLHQEIES